jgi:hypothetical protein
MLVLNVHCSRAFRLEGVRKAHSSFLNRRIFCAEVAATPDRGHAAAENAPAQGKSRDD